MGVDLDKLQREAEKLLKLLQDRQPGLATWNKFLSDQLKELKRLIGQAGL